MSPDASGAAAGAMGGGPLPVAGASGGLWAESMKRLRRNRMAVAATIFLAALALASFGAPWLPGLASPTAQDLDLGASTPSAAHPLGTDLLGRDVLARVL